MFRAQSFPLATLLRQCIRLKDWKSNQRGNNAHQNVPPDFELPEPFQSKVLPSSLPAGQSHAALASEEAGLAEFMVAEISAQLCAKLFAQFFQTFSRALASRVIAHPYERRVARIVPAGNDVIKSRGFVQEAIQEMILIQRFVQPNKAPMHSHKQPEKYVFDGAKFV